MKKIIAILVVFISFITINVVHADMSAPEMRAFEVEVTAESGVDYYKWDGSVAGHLNKGDKVYVIYEYNGTYTLGVDTVKYGMTTKESIGDVNSLEGFAITEEEVKPDVEDDRIVKYDNAKKALVYATDGVDIYKGPSDAYKKVGHIKKGTELTYKYAIQDIDITYIYVDYEGTKGWVEILNGKVLIQNETQYIFRIDIDTECGTIPKNSITTPTYRTDKWEHKTQFEYNNCNVLIDSFRDSDILDVYVSTQKVLKDITLYKDADSSSEVVATIPSGTEVTILAGGDFISGTESVRYIKYNDVYGWALDGEDYFEWTGSTSEEEKVLTDTIKVEEKKPAEKPEKPSVKKGIDANTLLVLCAFGVGILVITALVIIILINRKKKAKTEVTATEEVKTKESKEEK